MKKDIIQILAETGKLLISFSFEENTWGDDLEKEYNDLKSAVINSGKNNGWFDKSFVLKAIGSWGDALTSDKLEQWLEPYKIEKQADPQRIGIVMAGNIPLVGFHDLISVIVSGHEALVKMSSDDEDLIPAVYSIIQKIDANGVLPRVLIADGTINGFDAVIATGSDNSARYFEKYFGKYPNIIRKNRNSVAILKGDEDNDQLKALCYDLFDYFGLGCRSVSKLYVPSGYNFEPLLKVIDEYDFPVDNNKYKNNYDYQKSIFLINSIPFVDNIKLLFREGVDLATAVSVVNYEYYTDINSVKEVLKASKDQIQCVVTDEKDIISNVDFGQTQSPELWDYADGVDTMEFLLTL